eukprot:TRINITY_DN1162_c1_g1_i1.p1 TRINITY_DN1162_c1_g1~~TRINITY_DN1162_c1_g1_i1.p1  ORF type:complete len:1744 (-),score=651.19 TRINITY_DN1162_c1_g1_i1:125-5356(-)
MDPRLIGIIDPSTKSWADSLHPVRKPVKSRQPRSTPRMRIRTRENKKKITPKKTFKPKKSAIDVFEDVIEEAMRASGGTWDNTEMLLSEHASPLQSDNDDENEFDLSRHLMSQPVNQMNIHNEKDLGTKEPKSPSGESHATLPITPVKEKKDASKKPNESPLAHNNSFFGRCATVEKIKVPVDEDNNDNNDNDNNEGKEDIKSDDKLDEEPIVSDNENENENDENDIGIGNDETVLGENKPEEEDILGNLPFEQIESEKTINDGNNEEPLIVEDETKQEIDDGNEEVPNKTAEIPIIPSGLSPDVNAVLMTFYEELKEERQRRQQLEEKLTQDKQQQPSSHIIEHHHHYVTNTNNTTTTTNTTHSLEKNKNIEASIEVEQTDEPESPIVEEKMEEASNDNDEVMEIEASQVPEKVGSDNEELPIEDIDSEQPQIFDDEEDSDIIVDGEEQEEQEEEEEEEEFEFDDRILRKATNIANMWVKTENTEIVNNVSTNRIIAQKDEESHNLKEEIEMLRLEIEEMRASAMRSKAQKEQLESENSQLNFSIEELTSQLRQSSAELKRSEERLGNCNQKSETFQRELNQLRQLYTDKELYTESIKEELHIAKINLNAGDGKAKKFQEDELKTRHALELCDQRCQALLADLERSKLDSEAQSDTLERLLEENKACSEENQSLLNTLETQRMKSTELIAEMKVKDNRIINLERMVSDLQLKITVSSNARDDFNKKWKESQSMLIAQQLTIKSLKEKTERIEQLKEPITDLKSGLEAIREPVFRSLNEFETWMSECRIVLSAALQKDQLDKTDYMLQGEQFSRLFLKEFEARRSMLDSSWRAYGNIRSVCVVMKPNANLRGDGKHLYFNTNSGSKCFAFDYVLQPQPDGTPHKSAFASLQPLVRSVLDGHKGCIFVAGSHSTPSVSPQCNSNVIYRRILQELFEWTMKGGAQSLMFNLQVRCFEVRSQEVYDLLSDTSLNRLPRQIHHSSASSELSSVPAATMNDVLLAISRATKSRVKLLQALNTSAVRSHMIVQIAVDVNADNVPGVRQPRWSGELNIVELGQAEKMNSARSWGLRGLALKETIATNEALTSIGSHLQILRRNRMNSQQQKQHMVPPPVVVSRKSLLLRMLAPVLNGSGKLVVLACVGIEPDREAETLSTLGLSAARASTGAAIDNSMKKLAGSSSTPGYQSKSRNNSNNNNNDLPFVTEVDTSTPVYRHTISSSNNIHNESTASASTNIHNRQRVGSNKYDNRKYYDGLPIDSRPPRGNNTISPANIHVPTPLSVMSAGDYHRDKSENDETMNITINGTVTGSNANRYMENDVMAQTTPSLPSPIVPIVAQPPPPAGIGSVPPAGSTRSSVGSVNSISSERNMNNKRPIISTALNSPTKEKAEADFNSRLRIALTGNRRKVVNLGSSISAPVGSQNVKKSTSETTTIVETTTTAATTNTNTKSAKHVSIAETAAEILGTSKFESSDEGTIEDADNAIPSRISTQPLMQSSTPLASDDSIPTPSQNDSKDDDNKENGTDKSKNTETEKKEDAPEQIDPMKMRSNSVNLSSANSRSPSRRPRQIQQQEEFEQSSSSTSMMRNVGASAHSALHSQSAAVLSSLKDHINKSSATSTTTRSTSITTSSSSARTDNFATNSSNVLLNSTGTTPNPSLALNQSQQSSSYHNHNGHHHHHYHQYQSSSNHTGVSTIDNNQYTSRQTYYRDQKQPLSGTSVGSAMSDDLASTDEVLAKLNFLLGSSSL